MFLILDRNFYYKILLMLKNVTKNAKILMKMSEINSF